MTDTKPIRRIAIIGTGVIGASWTALIPARGPQLVPTTVAPHPEARLGREAEFYTSIGQRTVRLNKELAGHVANRLQAALGREVYYLVSEGVVSAADVDTALSWGPGLRWGVMGNMMLNHLGGGPG